MRRMFDIQRSELDESGARVFDVDLAAVRTHPADVHKVVKAKGLCFIGQGRRGLSAEAVAFC